jgi:hypothetical protein
MKKFLLTSLTLTSLLLTLTFVFPVKDTAGAAASSAASASAQSVNLPRVNIFALDNANNLFVLRVGSSNFTRVNTISNVGDAQVIGMDFRVADNQLYALTDNGRIFTINTANAAATLVSNMNPRYNGGVQSLLDFNPVANAIRLIGTDDLNYAVVNNGGNLNQTAVQTNVAYARGDRNAGADPYICGGSYTNNFAGAATTLFYAIDYRTDNFVTIANRVNGSSATGGGQLQSIGFVFDNNNIQGGTPVNFRSTSDMDIVTINRQVNIALITNSNRLLVLPLSQINQNLAVGASQNLGAFGVALAPGGFLDIAMQTPGPLN